MHLLARTILANTVSRPGRGMSERDFVNDCAVLNEILDRSEAV